MKMVIVIGNLVFNEDWTFNCYIDGSRLRLKEEIETTKLVHKGND